MPPKKAKGSRLIENRKYIRLKAPLGVAYRVIRKHKRPKTVLSLIKDISGGGTRFILKDNLRAGDLLHMEIQIPHLEDPIRALGEVVWISPGKEKDRESPEAGVRFRDLAPRDLNCILEFVHTIGIG